MLNVTDWYVISPAASKGASPQSGTLCVFLRHESEAQRLSAQCNKRTFLLSLPSPFASPSSPGWLVCPLPCWDNLHVYPDFPSFTLLWPKLSHANWNRHDYFGSPANRAHTK